MSLYNLIAAKAVMNAMDRAAEKDKRLRDAAPELLRALETQVRNCLRCTGTGVAVPKDCDRCRDGRAALAKARGDGK